MLWENKDILKYLSCQKIYLSSNLSFIRTTVDCPTLVQKSKPRKMKQDLGKRNAIKEREKGFPRTMVKRRF